MDRRARAIFDFHFSKPPFSIGENDENPFFLSHSVAVKQPETSRNPKSNF
jgi:hypothetical protein